MLGVMSPLPHIVCKTFLGLSFNTMFVASKVLSTAPPVRTHAGDKKSRLVWMDLEMTGLDFNVHHIMEASCVVTDSDLNLVDEGINIIIHTPDDQLDKMNDWCKDQHGKSGLTDSCRKSLISLTEAEDQILSYLHKNTIKGASPLAGNTIYMDRLFLMKYMPRVNDHLHYRIVDVSSIKELCCRWAPKTLQGAPRKAFAHRSMDDIISSIEELKFYKNNFMKMNL